MREKGNQEKHVETLACACVCFAFLLLCSIHSPSARTQASFRAVPFCFRGSLNLSCRTQPDVPFFERAFLEAVAMWSGGERTGTTQGWSRHYKEGIFFGGFFFSSLCSQTIGTAEPSDKRQLNASFMLRLTLSYTCSLAPTLTHASPTCLSVWRL